MDDLPDITIGPIKEEQEPDWRSSEEPNDDEPTVAPAWLKEMLGFDPFEAEDDAARADAAWDEAKHPRDEGGKFASIGASGAKPNKAEGWTKVGEQLGSNPGGTYRDLDYNKHYVKFYKNEQQGKTEALAGEVLKQLGIETTKPEVIDMDGKEGVSVPWNKNLDNVSNTLQIQDNLTVEEKEQLADMFGAAVLTNNWDTVGLVYDNIAYDNQTKKLVQMDLGGAFEFRAQGQPKDYGDNIDSYFSLMDPQYSAGKVFSKLFGNNPELFTKVKEKLDNLNLDNVQWAFKQSGLKNAKDLYDKFVDRYNLLKGQLAYDAKKAGKTSKAAEPWDEPWVPATPSPPPPPVTPSPPPPPAGPPPGWAEEKMYGKTYTFSPSQLHIMKQFIEAKKAYESAKGTPAAKTMEKTYVKARELLKKKVSKEYFDAKFKMAKSWQLKVPTPTAAGAASATAPLKKQTAPPLTEAEKNAVWGKTTAVAPAKKGWVQAIDEHKKANIAAMEALLAAEATYEHNKDPAAYAPKLEAAKKTANEYLKTIGDFQTHIGTTPDEQPYVNALMDFLTSKDTIAKAITAGDPVTIKTAKAAGLAAKQQLQTAVSQAKSGAAPAAAAPAAPAAPAGPVATGTSKEAYVAMLSEPAMQSSMLAAGITEQEDLAELASMFSGLRRYSDYDEHAGQPLYTNSKHALMGAIADFSKAKSMGKAYGLSGREAVHIYAYCGPMSRSLNQPLRNSVMTKETYEFAESTNAAMDKMPSHNGQTVYRKASLPAKEFKKYIVGHLKKEQGFTSCAKKKGVWSGTHHYVIKTKAQNSACKDVQGLSPHYGESEALFKYGTSFMVTKIVGNEIHMEEV